MKTQVSHLAEQAVSFWYLMTKIGGAKVQGGYEVRVLGWDFVE